MNKVEKLIAIYQQVEDAGLMVTAGKKSAAELMVSHDVVPVVRCKDCKYGMKSHLQPRHAKNYLCRHSWEGEYHEPNHFCSYGERKDND